MGEWGGSGWSLGGDAFLREAVKTYDKAEGLVPPRGDVAEGKGPHSAADVRRGPLIEEVTCCGFGRLCSARGGSTPSRRPPKSVRFQASEVAEPLQLNGVGELAVASSRQLGPTSMSIAPPSTSVKRRL